MLHTALQDQELAKLASVQQAIAAGDAENWLRHQLRVSFPEKTDLIEVSCGRADPKEAVALVNVVVNTYLKQVERIKREARLKALDQERKSSTRISVKPRLSR